jgi:hypothetical protein
LTACAALTIVARMNRRGWILLITALLAGWVWPAAGQSILVQAQGNVRFVSGGIGEDERLELAAMHAEFNVHMTFAVKRAGNFIADVGVEVSDAAGRVLLDTVSQGPWLYARFAPGSYRLRARYGGVEQRRDFRVPAGRHTELYLYWDDPAAREDFGQRPDSGMPPAQRQ